MLLCYHIAGLRNVHANGVKSAITTYAIRAGLSQAAVNLMADLGYMTTYQTAYLSTVNVSTNHESSVRNYLKNNSNNVMVVNFDDYHDCHTTRIPDMSTKSKINHMATTLLNTPQIPAILSNTPVHQNGLLVEMALQLI